jgi:hypothetical protein
MTSGEMVAGSRPVGSVMPVVTMAETEDGFTVPVTIYEASYCGETVRRIRPGDARAWLREKRIDWEMRNGGNHERLKIRGRIARLSERVESVLADSDNLVGEDTKGVLADAMALLNVAVATISDDGTALTIEEAKEQAA